MGNRRSPYPRSLLWQIAAVASLYASPMASGTVAAIAEGWMGAAQGLTNIVFLSAAEQTSAGICVTVCQ